MKLDATGSRALATDANQRASPRPVLRIWFRSRLQHFAGEGGGGARDAHLCVPSPGR